MFKEFPINKEIKREEERSFLKEKFEKDVLP
jgi:hypothetical protein